MGKHRKSNTKNGKNDKTKQEKNKGMSENPQERSHECSRTPQKRKTKIPTKWKNKNANKTRKMKMPTEWENDPTSKCQQERLKFDKNLLTNVPPQSYHAPIEVTLALFC